MDTDWETERREAGYEWDWNGEYSNYCQWCHEETTFTLPDGGSDYVTVCPKCGHQFIEYEGDLRDLPGDIA